MDINKIMSLLEQALSETEDLRTQGLKKEEFELWRNKILDILEAGFGKKSTEFDRFATAVTSYHSFYTEQQRKEEYNRRLVQYVTALKSIIQKHKILGAEEKPHVIEVAPESVSRVMPPKAFIAHGGESPTLNKLKDFLMALGVEPLIVEELPSENRSIGDNVDFYARQSDCAIILATKGDIDGKTGDFIPRGNVLIEMGKAQELFKDRIIYLLQAGVKFPSNISEKVRERFTTSCMDDAFIKVARELVAFGILKAIKPQEGA